MASNLNICHILDYCKPSGDFRQNRQFRQNHQSPTGLFWHPIQIARGWQFFAIFAVACISGHKCLKHPRVSTVNRTATQTFRDNKQFDSFFRLNPNVYIDVDNRERARARNKNEGYQIRLKKNMKIL